MGLNEEKRFLLTIIQGARGQQSFSEIYSQTGGRYKERTLRRTLSVMVEQGLILRIGKGRSTRYAVSKSVIEANKVRSFSFSNESRRLVEEVKKSIYEKRPVSYSMDWFNSYVPNSTFYLSQPQRDLLHRLGTRNEMSDPAGSYAHKVYDRLLIDLSYNSSRLEGNTYSLVDTEKLILSGIAAEGKASEERVMILNHKEAIRYLVREASAGNDSLAVIYTLHYLLSSDLVDVSYSGKVRDHSVRISGSTYLPLDNSDRLSSQLEKIVLKSNLIKDPFEKSIFLLTHIGYLQPFVDVNKRTARLSANAPLIMGNYVPLSFNDMSRSDYSSAVLSIYELQNTKPLTELFIYSYERSCLAYDAVSMAVGFNELRARYRGKRRDLIRKIISQNIVGEEMNQQVQQYVSVEISDEDKKQFTKDLIEDLAVIDQYKIFGLGITLEELEAWKRKKKP